MRKTAAICVAKLYDISAELVDDRGFLDMLRVRARDLGRHLVQRHEQRPRTYQKFSSVDHRATRRNKGHARGSTWSLSLGSLSCTWYVA